VPGIVFQFAGAGENWLLGLSALFVCVATTTRSHTAVVGLPDGVGVGAMVSVGRAVGVRVRLGLDDVLGVRIGLDDVLAGLSDRADVGAMVSGGAAVGVLVTLGLDVVAGLSDGAGDAGIQYAVDISKKVPGVEQQFSSQQTRPRHPRI
jgi:hypothetical protein